VLEKLLANESEQFPITILGFEATCVGFQPSVSHFEPSFLLKSLWCRFAFLSTFVGAFITLETTILSVTYVKMTGTLPK
jgi:hypothetical protein